MTAMTQREFRTPRSIAASGTGRQSLTTRIDQSNLTGTVGILRAGFPVVHLHVEPHRVAQVMQRVEEIVGEQCGQ